MTAKSDLSEVERVLAADDVRGEYSRHLMRTNPKGHL